MKKKSKLKSISHGAIRRIMFYPLGLNMCSYALLSDKLTVIAEASGWSPRLAKKKCIKEYYKKVIQKVMNKNS